MANYKEIFANRHTVLPVVHVETTRQTLENANIAHEAGCDGIFLISMHGLNHKDLLEMHKLVRKEFATWWIGINFLDLPAIATFEQVSSDVSGIWADNAEIYEWVEKQVAAEQIMKEKGESGWKGLYFGGVAFKYQQRVNNLSLAAQIATKYWEERSLNNSSFTLSLAI